MSEERTTQRRSELMEKATHGVRNSDQSDVPGDSSSKDNIGREQRDTDAG